MDQRQAIRMGEAFIASLIPGVIVFAIGFFLGGPVVAGVLWILTLLGFSLYFATKEEKGEG